MIIKTEFSPVTIVLETKEELAAFKSSLYDVQHHSMFNRQSKYAVLAASYLRNLP